MPFRKWKVEPVFLSRKPIPPDKPVFESVTNASLVKSMEQLASLLKIADRIFDEIGSECRLVFERTQRLKVKVQVCVDAVNKLDAKAVQVPVADIEVAKGLLRRPQYTTLYDQSNQLFLPSTRPPCVDGLYNSASSTPVSLIYSLERDVRYPNPQLFMVTPVLGDVLRKKKKNSMLDIETRRPASLAIGKDRLESFSILLGKETSWQNPEPSIGEFFEESMVDPVCRLPSPEEQVLATSLEYPSSFVPVDVTGSSFLKMMKLRRSLIHVDFVIKRKKSKKKAKRRHTVCEGNSKELDDAVKNIDVMNASSQTDGIPEISSLSSSLRHSFSRRRGRATIENTRMELDNMDVEPPKRTAKGFLSPSEDSVGMSENKENTVIRKKSTKPTVKSRSSHFNPISSLSAAFSIAVKMRQASKTSVKQDDGRSSSGNWSASSSTRASVDSDQHHNISPSECNNNFPRNSLGKDSVCDAAQVDCIGFSGNGFIQKSIFHAVPAQKKDVKIIECRYETNASCRSSTSTPERTSDSTNTSVALSPYLLRKGSCSTHPSIINQDDGDSSVYSVDTDGYYTSMHTDSGLWNNIVQSFNIEENSTGEDFNFKQKRGSQSSVSTIGNSSINSFLSRTATEISSNPSSLRRQKHAPPPPPRLSSSHLPSSEEVCPEICTPVEKVTESANKSCSRVVQPPSGSTSESDHETRDRIQIKTVINSSRYPSMCAVSPETSEDETVDSRSFQKRKKSPVFNVVVAEVHREEKQGDQCIFQKAEVKCDGDSSAVDENTFSNDEKFYDGSIINMYGNQSLPQSSFSSSLVGMISVPISSTNTCNIERPITTFAPEGADLKHISGAGGINENSGFPVDDLIVNKLLVSKEKCSESLEGVSVPLKYSQKITVTPVSRNEANVCSPEAKCPSSTVVKFHNIGFTANKPPFTHSAPPNFEHSKNNHCNNTFAISNSMLPNILPPKDRVVAEQQLAEAKTQMQFSKTPGSNEKTIARVTLDPTGKVIYRSNSLDRRKCFKSQFPSSLCQKPLFATLPKYQGPVSRSGEKNMKKTGNEDQSTSILYTENRDLLLKPVTFFNQTNTSDCENSDDRSLSLPTSLCQTANHYFSTQQQYPKSCSPTSQDIYFRPSRGGRFCRTYFPPHLISSSPRTCDSKKFNSSFPTFNSKNCENAEVKTEQNFKESVMHGLASRTCTKSFNFNQEATQRDTFISQPSCDSFHSHCLPSVSLESQGVSDSGDVCTTTHCQEKNAVSFQNRSSGVNFRSLNSSKSLPTFAFHSCESSLPPQENNDESVYCVKHYTSTYGISTPINKRVPYEKADITSTDSQIFSASSKEITTGYSHHSTSSPCDIEQLSFVPSQPPDVIPSSASCSAVDITSPTSCSSFLQRNQHFEDSSKFGWLHKEQFEDTTSLKSLSSSELFTIIHNSKKKHNIKTESEKSLSPLSSRSSSPNIGLTPTKGIQIETGFLSKRNSRCLNPGDRHSWDSNRSLISSKKSLASDRFGKSKPTSMRDFKMLLLHARSGNEISPRLSAAELLKVSPPKNPSDVKQSSRALCFSPIKHNSSAFCQSPVLNAGHTTVPIKRVTRTRSPYLTRYDSAYPPILEDCLEESESVSDNLSPSPPHIISEVSCGKILVDNMKSNYRLEKNKPVVKATSTWV